MQKHPLHLAVVALLAAPVVAVASNAQESFRDLSFVGAGLTLGESVYSDSDARVDIEPYLFHNSKHGFINGSLANYALLPWFGISGNIRISEVSDDFNDIPDGIQDRDSSAELGVTFGTLGARVTYLHDVSDTHKGYEIQLHLGRGIDTPYNGLSVSPYVEVNYRDNKLSQHLYSVSQSESVASGLAQFNAAETWVFKGGVIGLYEYSESLLGIAKLELDHHDTNSPLLQSDFGWRIGLGAAYQL